MGLLNKLFLNNQKNESKNEITPSSIEKEKIYDEEKAINIDYKHNDRIKKTPQKRNDNNPHLYQLQKEDGYYEIKAYNTDINDNLIEKNSSSFTSDLFEKNYYHFKSNNFELESYYDKEGTQIKGHMINDLSSVYCDYVLNLSNKQTIIIYDVLLEENIDNINNNVRYAKKHCYINTTITERDIIINALFQTKDGIIIYSSIEGFFLIKDMQINLVSKDNRYFSVKPVNKFEDVSYIKYYDVTNINKKSIMYSSYSIFNDDLSIKEKYNQTMPSLYYYFTMDYSLASYILLYFAKKELKVTMLENIFSDDGTQNYCITIDNDKIHLLPTLYYLGERFASNRDNFKWNSPSIFSISCRTIISYLIDEFDKPYRSERIQGIIEEICIKIKAKMNLKTNIEVAQFIYNNYILYADIVENNYEYIYSHYSLQSNSLIFKEKYQELKEEVNELTDGKRRKWKNEYFLYTIIKKAYPDAEYQYTSDWLRKQSLDIYIPTLKIGIEYQGEQHYSALDIFGGSERYEKNIRRDETKKYLCMINDVKLLQWSYEEIISTIVVEKKINKLLNDNSKVKINYDLIDEFENENPGKVFINAVEIKMSNIDMFDRFIAFDTETTGIDSKKDRIIEVGAVYFENKKKKSEFGKLINPKIKISKEASDINKITNEMIEKAPLEKEVYEELMEYWSKIFSDSIVLCAHNARFDMDFLSKTLIRLGYNTKIIYVDTLRLSRKLIKGLPNYKQKTIAEYFGIINTEEHRALTDAEVCGEIFIRLLEIQNSQYNKIRRKVIQYDDKMNIINKYNSVSEAARTVGVNDKSIRLAATGRQLHAGNYIWKYENSEDTEIIKKEDVITQKNTKPVIKYDEQMNVVGYYKSIGEASRKSGINQRSISAVINGSQKTAGGFFWKQDEETKENPVMIKTTPIENKIEQDISQENERKKVIITHWYDEN